MSHTFTRLAFHLVFATKNRYPFMTTEIRERLFPYMGGIVRSIDGLPIITNGPADHIHQLCYLPPRLSLSEVLRTLKAVSSGWVHKTFPHMEKFAWQGGYGAFSVGEREVDVIKAYIQNQLEHHRVRAFQEEYVKMLQEHHIDFDAQHILD